MAPSLKHKFLSVKDDGADPTVIQPSYWNDEHSLTLADGKILGRAVGTGTGEAIEIPIQIDAALQSMRPPAGTTVQRPATPVSGMIRYNTTSEKLETYRIDKWLPLQSSAFVSATAPTNPQNGELWYNTTTRQLKIYNNGDWVLPQADIVIDTLSGDGATVDFELSADPGFENNLSIFVGSDYVPKTQYSVDGTTLTFATAPVSGANNIEVEFLTSAVSNVPANLSVTTGKMADKAVTNAKLANGAVSNQKLGNGAVNSSKLANGAVVFTKINPAAVTTLAEGIGAGASDVSLPTAAAVKGLVDAAVAAALASLTPEVIMAKVLAIPYNGVGAIAMMQTISNAMRPILPGQEFLGSNLRWSSAWGDNAFQTTSGSEVPAGVWRCLCYMPSVSTDNDMIGLFQRIS
jgi:hypothetical protein